MRKWESCISLIIIQMIVMSTIIQFHHHDTNGNIILAISVINCNNHNEHCSNTNVDNHNHIHNNYTCDHNDTHKDCSGNKCITHFDDYQIAKQTSIALECFPIILLADITQRPTIQLIACINEHLSNIYQYAPIFKGVVYVRSLRAPPTC